MTVRELSHALQINERAEISFLSQVCHMISFELAQPKRQHETGMLIISVDVDVGSRELGVVNRGKNDVNVHRRICEYLLGKIEETALPLFVETFSDFEIPVTFAIRGQLTELNGSTLDPLLESSIKHDIGAHGYSHRAFTDLTRYEAEKELSMTSSGMKKFGIAPKSFVFPRNRVAHLDLLEKHGYKCYRSRGGLMRDSMYIEKCGETYDIHPSLYIDQHVKLVFLKKILNISITRKLPLHIWFHLWNFGETKESMLKTIHRMFIPLFKYTNEKKKSAELAVRTMLSAAEEVEMMSS